MHNLPYRVRIPRAQQHDFALVARFAPGIPPPEGKAHALPGLGLPPQAHPHPAQGQIFQHQAAFLQDAGKGHDAAGPARRGAHGLGCHISGQTGAVQTTPGLLAHGHLHFLALHILRIEGVPGAKLQTRPPVGQGQGQTRVLHALQHGRSQLVADPAAAGRQQKGKFIPPCPGRQHI